LTRPRAPLANRAGWDRDVVRAFRVCPIVSLCPALQARLDSLSDARSLELRDRSEDMHLFSRRCGGIDPTFRDTRRSECLQLLERDRVTQVSTESIGRHDEHRIGAGASDNRVSAGRRSFAPLTPRSMLHRRQPRAPA
jgi:hypothetical protein